MVRYTLIVALLVAGVRVLLVVGAAPLRDSEETSVEKDIKCHGGFQAGKGFRKCEGGLKHEFTHDTKAKDVAEQVAFDLQEQVAQLIPEKGDIFPERVKESMMALDNEDVQLDEGFSKTIEFGGFMKAEWGCKVTFEMKDGSLHKTSSCGIKGMEGMGKGKAPNDEDMVILLD
eukprot:scaffold174699_cov45-Attheya_sp.AAC.1